MFTAAVEFLKEYGDVLGAIGTLSAFTMLLITNGRVILQRLRGQKPVSLQAQIFGGKTAIVVLPVKEQGQNDTESSAFADSLDHELHTDLLNAGYAAPAPDLTRQALQTSRSGTEITKKLGVDYALETNLRRQGDVCRVTARLTNKQGAVVWSDRFDCSALDTIKAPEEMAASIVAGIQSNLDETGLAPSSAPTPTAAAIQTDATAVVAAADANAPSIALSGLENPIQTSPKSRFIAFMLCAFVVGLFGAHRFYVGRPFTGTLYIFTVGLLTIGWIFDIILIALGMFADGKGRPVRNFHPRRDLTSA